jgi:tetratricopeptide (TPR) repeat protein
LFYWDLQVAPLFAVQLSDLELVIGEFAKSREWAEKALEVSTKPGLNHIYQAMSHGISKRALSNAGRACFNLGQRETADTYARKAWQVWVTEDDGGDDDAAFIPAENFDVLAQIKMQAGDLGQAEQLFTRSSELRTRSIFTRRSASAYVNNSRGTVELARNNKQEAIAPILEAAQILIAVRKKNFPFPPDINVVVSVLQNLRRLESDVANQTFQDLYSRHKRDFCPVHQKLLS